MSSLSDSGLEDNFQPQHPKLRAISEITHKPIPPEEAGLTKLAHFIAEESNENESAIIVRATHVLGRVSALKYFEFALRSQKSNAGYLTQDGSRIRTLGGLFLRLIKDDPGNEPATVKEIFAKKSKFRPKIQKFEPQQNPPKPSNSFTMHEVHKPNKSVLSGMYHSKPCLNLDTNYADYKPGQNNRRPKSEKANNPFEAYPPHKKPMFLRFRSTK